MGQHSRYAPSHLHRVARCPGYLQLLDQCNAPLEGRGSDESEEGTAAHWVASEALHGRHYQPGDLTPEGYPISDEMIQGAELWEQALAPYRNEVECIEDIRAIPAIHPDCFGTADYDWAEPRDGLLVVADYKFGHKYVEVFENDQLVAYARSRCTSILPTVKVLFVIVQPRSYCTDGPIRTWSCSMPRLIELADDLVAACKEADNPEAVCSASEACYCCPVRHDCRAAIAAEQMCLDTAEENTPLDAPIPAQALRLRQVSAAIKHLEQMKTGLEEVIVKAIKDGENVSGFELRPSSSRLKWQVSDEQVVSFGELFGLDLKKRAVLTPTQAIAVANKAGLPAETFDTIAKREAGAPVLAPVDMTHLRKVFGKEEPVT